MTDARYPLLIHPDDVGSRAPLDPVEARACRRIKASELAASIPWTEVERVVALVAGDPVDALYWVSDLLDPLYRKIPGAWVAEYAIDSNPAHMHERESAASLASVKTPAEFAAWCEAWLIVHAWVCEGDEPAPKPMTGREILERAREAAEHFTAEDFDRMVRALQPDAEDPTEPHEMGIAPRGCGFGREFPEGDEP